MVLQAVHMVFAGERGKPWGPNETRVCSLVLIGLSIDAKAVREDFKRTCIVGEDVGKGPGGPTAQAYRKALNMRKKVSPLTFIR